MATKIVNSFKAQNKYLVKTFGNYNYSSLSLTQQIPSINAMPVRLSKKQKEVIKLLRDGHPIHWMGGLNPRCYISNNLNYRLSISTVFALFDAGLIEIKDRKSLNDVYTLTPAGESIDLGK